MPHHHAARRGTSSMAAILAGKARLIPVLQVDNADHAEPLLTALESAGIAAIEVTLRTPAALEVIRRMSRAASSATVGAGTLTRPEQFAQIRDAGAGFAVSPALTPTLAEAAHAVGLPYVPGVATPSEVLRARELGFHELKFFPADLMGGTGWLRHMLPLYPDVSFCPTGGISDRNIGSFLELANVFAAGGVYLAPAKLIEAARWEEIRQGATQSVAVAAPFQ
ncbi:MAG: bifunctional 4-hydroxy-2-oxoglutarate aldolase/2-dehydro-3-deoxy-phosphogluconate aldolase [Rhizobiales bacterium]|nr:bifunctional 4-hydroxy-2-oxoglutarate aldolase/2-dehydro-3-deoxy-phosphogluconate aldolase [Hyphomicrobiales bacterium]